MEGVGSRLGRASSRYGPSATANVFNGPVRKWKKKWVHVSPPPATNNSSHSQSNGHRHGGGRSNISAAASNGGDNGSRLLLCRWTPLGGGEGDGSSAAEEPPKRRYRYTPIAALEERKKAAGKSVDLEANEGEVNEMTDAIASIDGEPEPEDDEAIKEGAKDPDTGTLDLGLCLKGQSSENESPKGEPAEKATPGRAWEFG